MCPSRNIDTNNITKKRPRLLENYNNPCWIEDGNLRCLPYFYIFGVCKSGTTDLFRRLMIHYQIMPNKGLMKKETWFWSWKRYGEHKLSWKRYGEHSDGQISTLKNFTDLFDVLPQRITYSNDIDMYYSHFVTGHGDPMDIWYPFDWTLIPQNNPTSEEPVYITPNLIYHLNPNIKLTVDSFIFAPISSGFCSTFLRDWLKVFDNDQIMVIRTEDYRHDIAGTLVKLFKFLNLDEVGPYVLKKMACRELEYKTNYRSPIMNKTRSLLETFYYDSQRDMDSLLEEYGIDLSLQQQNEMASKINCSRCIARKPLLSKLKRNKVKPYFVSKKKNNTKYFKNKYITR